MQKPCPNSNSTGTSSHLGLNGGGKEPNQFPYNFVASQFLGN